MSLDAESLDAESSDAERGEVAPEVGVDGAFVSSDGGEAVSFTGDSGSALAAYFSSSKSK